MPLLAVNLSDKLFADIKLLVEKAKYESPEAFLEIAAFNQLALERGATPMEIVERGHRKIKKAAVPSDNGDAKETRSEEPNKPAALASRRTVQAVAKKAPDNEGVSAEEIAAATKRLILATRGKEAPAACTAAVHKGNDARVWGQVNRLFPLKLACRWLSTAATIEGSWPKFETINDRLADDAATIGTLLEKADTEADRKREDLLATGLPRRGNSASRDRFLSQFLARITRAGDIFPGAIYQYELARFNESVICLTDRGQAFADLKNPLLDGDLTASAALDQEETKFLVEQIQQYVPVERDDLRIILSAVLEGKATPVDLFAAVGKKFAKEWSEVMVRTHISGLIARLGDLRLLKRNWQGRNVNYEIGDQNQVEIFLKD